MENIRYLLNSKFPFDAFTAPLLEVFSYAISGLAYGNPAPEYEVVYVGGLGAQ